MIPAVAQTIGLSRHFLHTLQRVELDVRSPSSLLAPHTRRDAAARNVTAE